MMNNFQFQPISLLWMATYSLKKITKLLDNTYHTIIIFRV